MRGKALLLAALLSTGWIVLLILMREAIGFERMATIVLGVMIARMQIESGRWK